MLNEIKKIIYRNSYLLRKNKMKINNFFNTNQIGGIQVNSINDRTNKEYNKNKEIIKKITITQINILKYIELTKKEKIINDIKKILLIKPDMLVTDFLSQFLKKYNKTCKYFFIFYEKLFKDLNLIDFYKQPFALKL